MNSKSLRRLAADHGSLHTAGLPPNFLFPPSADGSEDLTSLDVLLAGPVGTPYASGVWRLHLDIPNTYPAAPPTAQFRTRLWHPNIDEATGSVCVETLKRDWKSTLKLRDVLVTISCLLIQPNPASALNEAAGKLANEDWDGFCRRAKLMTEIHAAVPATLAADVREAQMRGEEEETVESGSAVAHPQTTGKGKDKEPIQVPPPTSKVQRLAAEDEENTRRRGETQEPESDPESDWIPGPDRATQGPSTRPDNIFGIKGLEDSVALSAPPKRIFSTSSRPSPNDPEDQETTTSTEPFITTTTSRPANPRAPSTPTLNSSHQPPLSALQPTPSLNPLLKEFSYSWEEAHVLHDDTFSPSLHDNDAGKLEVRKRIASDEFERRKEWEAKRFQAAGCSLRRWNRRDWGPRTGVGRL
ncbi:UBC-like protein [Pyrenochaeta sp. DS3sAY3a]|nr:UBC-like protein [Pyrenochaeta sp. DS3sAY3a]